MLTPSRSHRRWPDLSECGRYPPIRDAARSHHMRCDRPALAQLRITQHSSEKVARGATCERCPRGHAPPGLAFGGTLASRRVSNRCRWGRRRRASPTPVPDRRDSCRDERTGAARSALRTSHRMADAPAEVRRWLGSLGADDARHATRRDAGERPSAQRQVWTRSRPVG
jgi:hypothetical protein